MALVITKIAASSCRLRYLLEQTAAAADGEPLSLATMIADAANGPLKDRLTALAAAAYLTGRAFWNAFFDDTDGQLSAHMVPYTNALPSWGNIPALVFDLDGGGLPIIDVQVGGVIYTYLDIVLNHTLTR